MTLFNHGGHGEHGEGKVMPVITLWQPWAQWCLLGWKTIETRTHMRFVGLTGKTMGIHAAWKWDPDWLTSARAYLSEDQVQYTRNLKAMETDLIGGRLIGTAYVNLFRRLTAGDSKAALIDCETVVRFGLFLERPRLVKPLALKGHQGVWYVREDAVIYQ